MSRAERTDLINVHTELRGLKAGEWVTADNRLTVKAYELISELIGPVRPSKKTKDSILEFTDNLNTYVEMFPTGKLPSGKQSRAHISNLEDAFNWFFKRYNYTWDVILTATQMYVTEYERKNYQYMRNSQYFIRKQNTDKTWDSELANYCATVESGETDIQDEKFPGEKFT